MTRPHGTVTAAELAAALAALGGTPDAVAATLRAAGVTGEPSCPRRCVVAEWLRVRLGLYGRPSVGRHVASVGVVTVRHPAALLEFLRRFDRGDYPDLLARVGGNVRKEAR